MRKIKIQLAALSASFYLPLLSVAQEGEKIDVNAVLSSLKAIKQKHGEIQKSEGAKLVNEITANAASPAAAVGYYEEAARATKFDGQNRENTQFVEWKHKEADHLKDKNWQEALRLHLTYLAIALQRSNGAEVKDLLSQLLNYTKQLMTRQDALGVQDEMLKHPLGDSIFVQWLQLGGQISKLEKWEMSPGNLDGIFQKTILPELRKQNDPRVIEYWDMRIQKESSQAASTQRTFDVDKFNQNTKPKLLWSRSVDLAALGQKSKAVSEMLALIKNNPYHPDVNDWIEKLEKLVLSISDTTISNTSGSTEN